MPFPAPSIPAPALNLYQWSYRGLAFGGVDTTATYQIQSANVDMPDVASGDVQRAIEQGEFEGVDVLPGADTTIVQVVTTQGLARTGMPTTAQAVAIDEACQALGGVMGVIGTGQQPLYVQMASGCYVRLAKPRKHNCPWDINRVYAGGAIATSLLHSTDPRWYLVPSQSQTVGLPSTIGGGLSVPVTAPVSLTGGSAGGLLTVVNAGTFESRPVLIVTGPCTNPVIANTSIAGAPSIGVNITLNAGDQLVIDTDWHSVVYTVAGSTLGSSRRNDLMTASTWWNLPANSSNTIEFTSSDTSPVAGTLTVWSASAFLTI